MYEALLLALPEFRMLNIIELIELLELNGVHCCKRTKVLLSSNLNKKKELLSLNENFIIME